ncbi:NADH-quinone oxidoreductase subunit NuoK [Desulfobotulus sp.]|jgi:NADH:ubiquinone oxidoreductase subunit K|uniref:NADH-quinone oxidoreductase subunit NuoK n=1 Tax=Desulfobotulus sp. TaxID=1940337 RepID=UPI002A35BFA8|nr:NADH-quinone oxidoreductase subunit NuoK [Desulfobotulus sp.]MDY0164084.1 NADH-quinone oxidoreductase subunit NuoK [Desulfobotulus sp.]
MLSVSTSLTTYLVIALVLFVMGIYGMVRHRSFMGMLISTELILCGASINFMAFNRFVLADPATGQVFTLFIMGIAAAEAAIVVSFILAVYRTYRTDDPSAVQDLRH